MTPAGRPGTNLPAPYVSPWVRLRSDLRDAAAWLGLKVRELARRNGQADLPRPSFWPRDLAPLFWPLVVLGAGLLVWAGLRLLPGSPPATDLQEPRAVQSISGGSTPAEEPQAPPVPSGQEGESASVELQEPEPPEAAGAGSEESLREVDPLISLFNDAADSGDLVLGVRTDPAAGRVDLRLGGAFRSLRQDLRQQAAARWQRRAATLGYERIDLLDPDGRLLGRNALVGSGMILLDAAAI